MSRIYLLKSPVKLDRYDDFVFVMGIFPKSQKSINQMEAFIWFWAFNHQGNFLIEEKTPPSFEWPRLQSRCAAHE
jgi:hypothetical protein